MIFACLPTLVAGVGAVSSATLTSATSLAGLASSSCSTELGPGVLRVVDISALASHPLATVVSEPALPRSAVFPAYARGVIRPLSSIRALEKALRALLTCLRHQIRNGKPMVVLRMVGLVADRASPATHLEICHTLRRISSHVGDFLGANLHVVVLPLAITTRVHRTDRNGVDQFSRSLRVGTALQLLRGALRALLPSLRLPRWTWVQWEHPSAIKQCRTELGNQLL